MTDEHNICNCEGCDLKSLFFNKVDNDELTYICSEKQEKNYNKGDIIINQGDEIIDFIYLKSGLVKLYKSSDNSKNQIIKFAGPLDFISMLSVFSDTVYHYSVSALENSTVCLINFNLIKKLAKENGEFTIGLLEKMSKISDDIIQTNLEIREKNLRGRIAYVLLYFANKIYKNNDFEIPVSRKEIAEFIEMTTENVIRIMSEFRKDGIIKINGKLIEIIDKEKLELINAVG